MFHDDNRKILLPVAINYLQGGLRMKKKVLSTVLTTALAASMVAGSVQTAFAEEAKAPEVSHDEELTLEVYDVASNYQGLQTGWFGKVLKDKFNIVLNIIAPQVSGDSASLYQTRTASGKLGDIILLDNADMLECVDAGLIADMGAEFQNYPNLMKYWEQIELFNANFEGEGSVYAIPTEMNTNGPTAYMNITAGVMPRIPWDYYSELGTPELATTDDLLDVLQQMQEAHPTNEAGDPAYGITLWKDWDGTSMENVNQIAKWYGQEVNASVLIGADNSIVPLTDKDGAYYKMLKFYFQANQRGIIDPDSATQDWNAACDKMRQKRTYLIWNNWMTGFTNSPEIGEKGANYMGIPIADMNLFQTSDFYYGSGRAFAIGAHVDEETKARIMEFFDWLASPEGCLMQHASLEDIIYTVNEDGTYTLTEDGVNRFIADLMIPDELGGGKWNDGNNQINQWIVSSMEINPLNGEPYDTTLWASTIEMNNTKTTLEWQEKYGAENEVVYMQENGLMNPVASVNLILDIDTTDIGLIRSQCKTLVCDSSWQAVFAADEAAFDAIWDDMCTTLEGLGWNDLVEFDTAKYQKVIDARKAAEE